MMKKYKVNVYTTGMLPETIEAENQIEALEKMFNMIMDNVDFYLDIVAEQIDEDELED